MKRIALLLAAVTLAGCGSDDGDDDGAGATGETVEIVATEFAFEPSSVTVDAAGEHTFTLTNEGEFPHALEIEGGGVEEESEEIGPGEETELTVSLDEGTYTIYCPVGDHREQGMDGELVVGGAMGAADDGGDDDAGQSGGGDYYR
jgi:plastocyanin